MVIATANRREGVYNRTGEPSVPFCEIGGARKRADVFLHRKTEQSELCSDVVLETGIEPVRLLRPQDFKSCASASSATRAIVLDYNSTNNLFCQLFFNFIRNFYCPKNPFYIVRYITQCLKGAQFF